MAGGGIVPTWAEYRLITSLRHYHLSLLLTDLDEDGWAAARERLLRYARMPEYQEPAVPPEEPTEDDDGEGR